jgi:hypothetical protein
MDVRGGPPIARWVAPTFIICSLVLIPWIVYLGLSLPSREVSHHNDIAWVGFDVFELMALGATGLLALRRSRFLALAAASAATLLVVDAWFDILTSPRQQVLGSIVLAVFIELPLAVVCGWLSYHTERVMGRSIRLRPHALRPHALRRR